jgi:hypothetical protein
MVNFSVYFIVYNETGICETCPLQCQVLTCTLSRGVAEWCQQFSEISECLMCFYLKTIHVTIECDQHMQLNEVSGAAIWATFKRSSRHNLIHSLEIVDCRLFKKL